MTKTIAAGVSVAFVVCTALGGSFNYKPDWDGGSGGWGDATRWYENGVPGAGDTAFIDNEKTSKPTQELVAYLTWADWEAAQHIGTFQPRRTKTKLVIDLGDHDVEYAGALGGQGAVVKLGSGAFRMKTGMVSYTGRLTVSNGWFRLGLNPQYSTSWQVAATYEVVKPGVLEFNSSGMTYAKGLLGDGTITNAANQQLQFLTSSEEHTFTGTIAGGVNLSAGCGYLDPSSYPTCRQNFTTGTGRGTGAIRLYAGMFGVDRFGMVDEFGVLGKGQEFNCFGVMTAASESGILNLGTVAQETDRKILIHNNNCPTGRVFRLDGGPSGGVTFSGEIVDDVPSYGANGKTWADRVTRFVLCGSNTTACTLSGAITEKASTNHLLFVKQGSGTWRFANNATRQFKTPIIVEEGKLEYETIAEAGESCSLGLATCFSTNWWSDAGAELPYAIYLGNGSMSGAMATFSYVGEDAARTSTRKIGINGAAAIANDSASKLSISGIEPATPAATLVLDGSNGDGEIGEIDEGAGKLSIEKRGTGTWILSKNVDFSGGLTVNGGTLDIAMNRNYEWYKITFKENMGDNSGKTFMHDEIGFWSADDQPVARGVSYNAVKNGRTAELACGECAIDTTAFSLGTADRTPAQFFNGTTGDNPGHLLFNEAPVLAKPETWRSVVVHLQEGSPLPVKYDLWGYKWTDSTTPGSPREARSWGVYGSVDGVVWDEISNVVSGNVARLNGPGWFTRNGWEVTTDTVPIKGYALSSTNNVNTTVPEAIDFVSVGQGATLKSDVVITTGKIVYDASKGAGTIGGIDFDAEGVIEIVGTDNPRSIRTLGYSFVGCKDISNLANWIVISGGKVLPRSVAVGADGLTLVAPGGVILVR